MASKSRIFLTLPVLLVACAPTTPQSPYVPALRYSGSASPARSALDWKGGIEESQGPDGQTHMRLATSPLDVRASVRPTVYNHDGATVTTVAAGSTDVATSGVRVIPSSERMPRPYQGPLTEGDPGVTSSLWRESQTGNEPFRDFRAWQAMDLVTIVVTEMSLGRHIANTEVRSKSEYLAAIENFLGLEKQTQNWSQPPNLSSLIKASTQDDFRGEGRTIREGQLNARISAVVAEVLPSGLLRIEGEKIISVNNEEQVMVISGLVRQRDISFENEVNASKIAQIRIDYFGKGTVGEAQYGGWLGRALRILWPF